ncbi:MAG: hypothetical protein M0Z31_13070 [Clostridia bacterium]|nr:hypothetical protein [Clostridia bacterium]
MVKNQWVFKKLYKNKLQGQVWIVENQFGQRGYFKFTTPRQWYYSGPMIADELIAAALAKELGLPVANLDLAVVRGPTGAPQKGLVSVGVSAKEVITWEEAKKIHHNPNEHVNNANLLCSIVVFDAWIVNIDRALGRNLVLYRNNPADKFDWYLIDHGHTLHDSPHKWKRGEWKSRHWERLWRFHSVPKGFLNLGFSREKLEPMINKIENLPPSAIDQAIKKAPRKYLNPRGRLFIKGLLLYRQKKIRTIITRWLNYKGKKEFGRS